jgi:hypothetical protein
MGKGKDRISEEGHKLDTSNFKVVKTTRIRVKGIVLQPDIASAPDATGYADTIAQVFETGQGGIFQHGAGETEFQKVPERHPKTKTKKGKLNHPDFSKFILVKTTTPTSVKGVVLPPDIVVAPDATEIANSIASVFETGQGGIFQHALGETRFKKK